MFCNATGVPEPTIYWLKDGKILRVIGDRLSISDITYKDKGEYTCTADNGIHPNVSASSYVKIFCKYCTTYLMVQIRSKTLTILLCSYPRSNSKQKFVDYTAKIKNLLRDDYMIPHTGD